MTLVALFFYTAIVFLFGWMTKAALDRHRYLMDQNEEMMRDAEWLGREDGRRDG